MAIQQWLDREDRVTREDRLARLDWLANEAPAAQHWTFPGGLLAKYLFEQARYSFVYGQFLATVILGLAYIEQTLAAQFYGAGRSDLERASFSVLLREAVNSGWLPREEYDNLERARQTRNRIAHFRRPLGEHSLERLAVEQVEIPYDLIEGDSRHVMESVLRWVHKNAF